MPKIKAPVPFRRHLLAHSHQAANGCLLWTGYIETNGYGRFYWEGVRDLAHRHAYRAYHGEIPDGLDVLHTCDTPACIEETHLYPGTHAQNMQDKVRRGRHGGGPLPGAGHHWAKLNNEEVRFIRSSVLPAKSLAPVYKVTPKTIRRIRKGETYAGA